MHYWGKKMEHDYKNIISHIDIDRSLGSVEYLQFKGLDDFEEFRHDIELHNDPIELHLIKTKSYKEALILKLKKDEHAEQWKDLLREEQKTFGGSKIFYINDDCSKLLVLGVPNEMSSKINMVITRFNKINEKISRTNSKIKKENIDIYNYRIKEASDKKKEEIINFINLNLRV